MNQVFRVVTRLQDLDDFYGSLTDDQYLSFDSSLDKFTLKSFNFIPISGYNNPISLGNLGDSNSVDPLLTISRTISSGSTNAHAFSDSSNFIRNGYAYNSFDARINAGFSGHTYDHYAAFQSLPNINNGSWSDVYGFYSSATVNGNITRFNHAWVDDCIGTGSITTQYGYYCASLAKATNNWAFYSAGSTPSRIGELSVGDKFWITPTNTSVEIGYNIRYKNGDWYPTETSSYYCLLEPHYPSTNSFAIFTGTTPSDANAPISDWHVSLRCANDSTAIGPSGPFIFGTISNMVQIGGVSSSFPAIKRNGAAINFRVANDSADADITSKGLTASGPILSTNTYTSATNFEQLRIRSNSTQYEVSSIVGSAGGSPRPIQIGHTNAAGIFSSALSIAIDGGVLASGTVSSVGSVATRFTAERTATANALIELKTSAGSIFVGQGASGIFGVSNAPDLTAAAFKVTTSTGDVSAGAITASGKITTGTSTTSQQGLLTNRIDPIDQGGVLIGFGSGSIGTMIVNQFNVVYQSTTRKVFSSTTNLNSTADLSYGRDSAGVFGIYTTAAGSTKAALTCGAITASSFNWVQADSSGGRNRLIAGAASGIDIQANENTNPLFRITYAGTEYPLSITRAAITANVPILVTNVYTSTTNFEQLRIRSNSTQYEISSIIGSAGGSNRDIVIGHVDAAGTMTAALTGVTIYASGLVESRRVYLWESFQGHYSFGRNAILGASSAAGVVGGDFGITAATNAAGTVDTRLRRLGSGSLGLISGDANSTTYGSFTAGAITANGLITTSGSANTYSVTLPNTVGIAARNSGNTAWNRILNYTAANQCAVGDFDGGGGGLGLYGSGANLWTISSAGHLAASGAFNITTTGTVTAPVVSFPNTTTPAFPASGIIAFCPGSSDLWFRSAYGSSYIQIGGGSTTTFASAGNMTVSGAGGVRLQSNPLSSGPTVFAKVPSTTAINFRNNADSADIDLTAGAITVSGPILSTNLYVSSTNFERLSIKSNSTQYEISSIVGSVGGSNRAIHIGHTNAAGAFTSTLTVATNGNISVNVDSASFTFGKVGTNSLVGQNGDLSVLSGGNRILLLGDNGSGLALASSVGINWSSSTSDAYSPIDYRLRRNAAGQLDARGDGGLRIRNLANSADAPLTVGAITASGDITSTGFKSGNGGLFFPAGYTVLRDYSGNNVFGVNATANIPVCSTNGYGIGVNYYTPDVILTRDNANILALRNTTNAQTLRLYNTYTSSTNNEFLQIRAVAGANFEIGPQNRSIGGSLRGLTIGGYVAGSNTITPWMKFEDGYNYSHQHLNMQDKSIFNVYRLENSSQMLINSPEVFFETSNIRFKNNCLRTDATSSDPFILYMVGKTYDESDDEFISIKTASTSDFEFGVGHNSVGSSVQRGLIIGSYDSTINDTINPWLKFSTTGSAEFFDASESIVKISSGGLCIQSNQLLKMYDNVENSYMYITALDNTFYIRNFDNDKNIDLEAKELRAGSICTYNTLTPMPIGNLTEITRFYVDGGISEFNGGTALNEIKHARICPPTYSNSVSSTITSASSLCIDGPPIAGTNVSITNSYALKIESGNICFFNGVNIVTDITVGTKIGTSSTQKLGFWNATPVTQPTTSVAAATRVGNAGTTITTADTFDGYTIAQVIKALRSVGVLA